MPRNNFLAAFERLAHENLPPHLEAKDFSGVKLHPRIKTEAEGGGWDNSATIFGLIQPAAHGKTMIVQVSPKTEQLMADNNVAAVEFLQADIRMAAELWNTHAVPHEQAVEKTVKL
jgi:hypothetical protein